MNAVSNTTKIHFESNSQPKKTDDYVWKGCQQYYKNTF
ncbi:hypothetical protein SAMN05444380_11080 [Thermophagus xiamenensis]|uniref:Uncharacterized protein n=1 Tax=Thermophagus xiamenensis TaxID=385682 RepID=A0A1I2A0Z1_9BACT|nr:hypothetical protein SAMN05444380_11080 [Thermophagus xiamenensis]